MGYYDKTKIFCNNITHLKICCKWQTNIRKDQKTIATLLVTLLFIIYRKGMFMQSFSIASTHSRRILSIGELFSLREKAEKLSLSLSLSAV